MPRSESRVKNIRTPGLVDLHFHGAFGIDLMAARKGDLDGLSEKLEKQGLAGFCATTLSAPARELREAVGRLGSWIRGKSAPGAEPLGIHLEGPFINPGASGAHPRGYLRKADLRELDQLWDLSHGTLKIITAAPELLSDSELKAFTAWARKLGIILSLGHSRATEAEAKRAFDRGFRGVTHAWNALPFHHRAPGPLGAALGRKNVYLELIIDQVHVSQATLRMTIDSHTDEICFVSDCAPAAATRPGTWHPFGNLRTEFKEGACRLPGGELAGGGLLLPESYKRWLNDEGSTRGNAISILRESIPFVTREPLRALGIKANKNLRKPLLEWSARSNGRVELRVSQ